VCDAALDREVGERAAFVAAACKDDPALRQEVEALMAHAQAAEGFLAAPVGALAAYVLDETGGALIVGRQISSYTILSHLGTGGMGEVYRARDTRLGRDVAIKILPRAFTSDPERRARFEREARMLASLNHPHIGAIYGVEEADGLPALVLELVEGPTLADRLQRGPVPVAVALTIARQIADALDAAHEKGIIHRDLKPANIKITSDGVAKVLDFGIAKAAIGDGSTSDLTQSPRMTVGGAREGVMLGTPAYMSPEQARGLAVDKRTDVWAFGCVLYELLTGRIAFKGQTLADTLSAVLERQPAWGALPETTPAAVRRLLERCLEKDRKQRSRDIGDVRLDLDDVIAGESSGTSASGLRRRSVRKLMVASAAVAVLKRHRAAVGLAAVMVLALLTTLLFFEQQAHSAKAIGASGRPSIAVLSFDTPGGAADTAWLGRGIPGMLLTGLVQMPGVDIVSSERIDEIFKDFASTSIDATSRGRMLEVARRAGASTVITGSVFKAGTDVRIDVRVEDVATGRVLAADSVNGADVFRLADDLTVRVRNSLKLSEQAPTRGVTDVIDSDLMR
jgi:TolB-like protein